MLTNDLIKKVEGIYYLEFNRNMIKCSINIPKNAPKNVFLSLKLELATYICVPNHNH